MTRFYRIQIGAIYLTKDGGAPSADNPPCKVNVRGADALLNPYRQTVHKALDGTPYVQTFNAGTRGRTLDIEVETAITKELWESLISLKNAAIAASASVVISGTGDIGNFNVQALPLDFEAQEFEFGRILKPVFRFITI